MVFLEIKKQKKKHLKKNLRKKSKKHNNANKITAIEIIHAGETMDATQTSNKTIVITIINEKRRNTNKINVIRKIKHNRINRPKPKTNKKTTNTIKILIKHNSAIRSKRINLHRTNLITSKYKRMSSLLFQQQHRVNNSLKRKTRLEIVKGIKIIRLYQLQIFMTKLPLKSLSL